MTVRLTVRDTGRSGLSWLLVLMLVWVNPVSATPVTSSPDIRILVDISGSMRWTDPHNLRQPAVRLLAQMLPDDTTAGLWTFGMYVNMLVPHREIDDAWRTQAIASSEQINSVALWTNIGAALERAAYDIDWSRDHSNTHFILLTDGKVDLSHDESVNERERARILRDIIPRFAQRGIRIHTVALSDEADHPLMEDFAAATGGSTHIAREASDLNRVFMDALDIAAPQPQIPLRDNRFTVDAQIREFTALIFRDDGAPRGRLELQRPDGSRASLADASPELRWTSDSTYDLITVRQPQAGEWQVLGELGAGSRVTVVSDLQLVVDPLPGQFYPGQELAVRAAFHDPDGVITNQEFLGIIRLDMTLTTEDGRSGTRTLSPDVPPADGIYREVIRRLDIPGTYQLTLFADGQTFSRQYTRPLVLNPPVSMVVNPLGAGDSTRYEITVVPRHPELALERSEAAMQVGFQGDAGEVVALTFDAEAGVWRATLQGERGEGDYQVSLRFRGLTQDGREFVHAPDSFTARFPRGEDEPALRFPLVTATPSAAVTPLMPTVTAIPDHGPIDLSQLADTEEAVIEAVPLEDEPEAPAGMAGWMLWAGVGGLLTLLMAGGAFWFVRRKRQSKVAPVTDLPQHDVTDDADDELSELLPAAAVAATGVAADESAAPEDAAGLPEQTDDVSAEPVIDDPLPEPEPEPEPELDAEPSDDEDDLPVVQPEDVDDIDRILDEALDTDEDPLDPLEDDTSLPEAEAIPEADDEEEFGLEDFDLADIDDLPDDTEPDDDKVRKDPDQK
ncbi:MAG: VWA domain-containing protein [Marinobacter sp.]|nr:VWA domain-containing protein [Marinobacter sp.]